ncbi:MAG: prepilin-type N-terminal cleavage/methylation domain-containing protein [Candidatus Roizmanbacteria bacterium]
MDSLDQSVQRDNAGFTLIELLVAMAVFVIISTIGYISVTQLRSTTNINTATDKFIADVRAQQILAMIGKTSSPSPSSSTKTQAIRFFINTPTYTAFECATPENCLYSPTNTTNFSYTLDGTITFSQVNLPNSQIIFKSSSGEFYGYSDLLNTIVLRNTSNDEIRTIQANSLGNLTNL